MAKLKKQIEFLNYFFLLLLFFFIPLYKHVTVWLLLLLAVNVLLVADYNSKLKEFKINKKSAYVLGFTFLYFLYLIGLLNTSNFDYAFFDLEVKFSMLLLPVIFFLIKDAFFTKELLRKYFIAYLWGVFANVIICLIIAFYKYIFIYHSSSVFFYSSVSFFFHPSYLSMYLNFGIIILLFSSFSNIKPLIQKKNISIALQLVFLIFIFLLSSKAGIISLILIYLFYVLYTIFVRKRYKSGLLILFILFLGVIVLLTTMPFVKERLKVAFDALKNRNEAIKADGESSADRILIWGTSVDVIKQNLLLGVGTGDVKDVLLNEYKEKGINFAYQQKLNAHSQYLQTFITLGISGGIVLLLSLFLPMIYSIKRHYYLYLMFLLLIVFNISVESMFENQAGVIFYTFFNSFLFLSGRQLVSKNSNIAQ